MEYVQKIVSQLQSPKRILIIDDSRDVQVLLTTLLQANGYVIDCTSNGEEALRLLYASSELPDVILLDLRMPVLDGFDFLKSKRKNPKIKDIPTVIMSGNDDIEMTREKTGNVEILVKPLHITTLMEVIERNSHLH